MAGGADLKAGGSERGQRGQHATGILVVSFLQPHLRFE